MNVVDSPRRSREPIVHPGRGLAAEAEVAILRAAGFDVYGEPQKKGCCDTIPTYP
jgi:hypothetical protein